MREEIEAAVHFMGRVIRASNSSISNFSEFKTSLSKILEERFQGHWHTDFPGKGQGYRSIRIHPTEPLDPVLEEAAYKSAFNPTNFIIPVEFTLWVDPKDVSCRFGDLKATYCTVLKNEDNKASTLNVDELLESAKALYFRQQHFTVSDNSPGHIEVPFHLMNSNEMLGIGYGLPSSSPPTNGFHMYGYVEGYLPSNFMPYPPRLEGGGVESMAGSPASYQASFTSTAVNTTPRKSGKNGHFRKGNNGSGRGSKHHHQNGDAASYNHNHNNNHNTNGHTPNGSSNWGSDRFHWVRGSKNQQQQQQQQHQQQQHQNSGSGKESK